MASAHINTSEGEAPRERYYAASAHRAAKTGGIAALFLEVIFAGGLAMVLMAFTWFAGLGIGVVIAVLTAIAIKGYIAPLAVGHFADRPKEGRDHLVKGLLITGPIVIALLFVVALVRGVPWHVLVLLFPWAMAGLAILLPVVAAVLLILAELYVWSTRLTAQYRMLDVLEREVAQLEQFCDRNIASPDASRSDAATTPRAPFRGAAAANIAAALLVAFVVVSGIGDHTARAAERGSDAEIWLDESTSVAESELGQTTESLAAVIPEVSSANGLRHWRGFRFANQPWREFPIGRETVPFPGRPACDPPTEAAQFFVTQSNDGECRDKQRAAAVVYQRGLGAVAVRLVHAIRDAPRRPSPCTAVGDLLERIRQTPNLSLAILLTDGVESCRRGGLPQVPPPDNGVRVIVVLLSSTTAPRPHSLTDSDIYDARSSALLRAAPWLTVVPPWRLTQALRGEKFAAQ